MKRKILFRGKIRDKEQAEFFEDWWYGDLIQRANGAVFIRQQETGSELEVHPKTVGQYTGITDKFGNKIFEDDIVVITSISERVRIVRFARGTFEVVSKNIIYNISEFIYDYKRLGNIHDNRELL